jgi:spermidine synthase
VVTERETEQREPRATTPAARLRPPLPLLVFVVGSASLGAEIAAARLLAPYFGASTTVWANTIATVLVALSVGYWLGGRLADRRPLHRHLCALVLVASVGIAAIPFVARPFLDTAVGALSHISAGAFLGSLLGVLVLVAGPVLLLGAVAPYAIRLSVTDVATSGATAGRLYGISTAGSLAGTFLAALLLVPFAGTRRTFLIFALALALVAVSGLRRRWLIVPLALAALIALPPGQIKAESDDGKVVYETETEYQYARVVEYPDGARALELNEGLARHSLYRPNSYLTGDYWDDFLVAPRTALGAPPRKLAILGNAAGTMARAYGHYFPETAIDAVEIDGEVTEIGRKYFDMRAPHLRTFAEDARPYLRRHTEARYDAIFVDAYRQPYIPFYLTTNEFFRLCRERLSAGGVVVINVGHPRGSGDLERDLTRTLRSAFPTVLRDPAKPTNTVLIASAAPASAGRLAAQVGTLPTGIRKLGREAAARTGPPLSGGEVFTDDRAPVEWLIDASIVKYAADGDG